MKQARDLNLMQSHRESTGADRYVSPSREIFKIIRPEVLFLIPDSHIPGLCIQAKFNFSKTVLRRHDGTLLERNNIELRGAVARSPRRVHAGGEGPMPQACLAHDLVLTYAGIYSLFCLKKKIKQYKMANSMPSKVKSCLDMETAQLKPIISTTRTLASQNYNFYCTLHYSYTHITTDTILK